MKLAFLFIILTIFFVPGCVEKDCGCAPNYNSKFYFGFEQGLEGWEAGFADYPVNHNPAIYELSYEHAHLPSSIPHNTKGFKISGHNRSDDLFMFIKKELSGLKPNTSYKLTFNIQLASQYPESSVGIGGSSGGSVYLKVGATQKEPLPVEISGYYRMNIDIGSQSNSGADMINIGTIGIPGNEFTYQIIERNNTSHPFTAKSDKSGKIWVIIGTDSAFEGLTTLYYSSIEIKFDEVK